MQLRRLLLSCILIAGPLCSIFLFPSANGQTYSTLTSYRTITTEFSNATTVTSVVSPYLTQFGLPLSVDKFVLIAPPPGNACHFADSSFTLTAGVNSVYSVNSTSLISFYVMSHARFNSWANGPTCVVTDNIVSQRNVTAAQSSFIVPSTGTYDFVFVNAGPIDANVAFTVGQANLIVKSQTIQQTQTQILMQTVMQQETEAPPPSPATWNISILAVFVLIVATGGCFFYSRRLRTRLPLDLLAAFVCLLRVSYAVYDFSLEFSAFCTVR